MTSRKLYFDKNDDQQINIENIKIDQSTVESHIENIRTCSAQLSETYAKFHETERSRWWRVLVYKLSVGATFIGTASSISLAIYSAVSDEKNDSKKIVDISAWVFTAISLLAAIPWYFTSDPPNEKSIAKLSVSDVDNYKSLLNSLKVLRHYMSNHLDLSAYIDSLTNTLEAEDINVRRAEAKNSDVSYVVNSSVTKVGMFQANISSNDSEMTPLEDDLLDAQRYSKITAGL